MAIDIRANVTCNLGRVISANISDDYIQGNGLIKTTGSCVIDGLISPYPGDIVTFSYSKKGVTRNVPKKLRVLSSFTDPFRRTTQIELGCKLTYLQDLKDPINWDALKDPLNSDYDEKDKEIITIPIHASSAMQKCLSELGISATMNPLTNKFSIAEFDFSPGYVQVLSDLLVSESYFGYLNQYDTLVVEPLFWNSTSSRCITKDQIIDVGPIGVGQLPGEAVTVSYNTLKLKLPDEEEIGDDACEDDKPLPRASDVNWETSTSSTTGERLFHYEKTLPNGTTIVAVQTYGTFKIATETTTYKQLYVFQDAQRPYYEAGDPLLKKVPARKVINESMSSVDVMGGVVQQHLNTIGGWSNYAVSCTTVTEYDYDDQGNEILSTEEKYGSAAFLMGSLGIDFAYDNAVVNPPSGASVPLGRTVKRTYVNGNFRKYVTEEYVPWTETLGGQHASSRTRDVITTAGQAVFYINELLGAYTAETGDGALNSLYLARVSSRTENSDRSSEEAPSNADLLKEKYADDDSDPNNGYSTPSVAEIELALGNKDAERRIELSMPYAPDDTFFKESGMEFVPACGNEPAGTKNVNHYKSQKSDAPQKANRFGRVQNKLLMGNRYGMNIQIAPELIALEPFTPFTVVANGLSGLYRVNATNWTLSSDGVIASIDALFDGAVGGTGNYWFPVASGITSLPQTPPIVDNSPAEIIGNVPTITGNAQAVLSGAFPSAGSGDGVQNQANGEFWVYDGSTWQNVGTNPGPTMQIERIIPAWNEKVISVHRIRTRIEIARFTYALNIETVIDDLITTISAQYRKITKIKVPDFEIIVSKFSPLVSAGKSIKPPMVPIDITGNNPSISIGFAAFAPFASIEIQGLIPFQNGPSFTAIQPPLQPIDINKHSPSISIGVAIFIPQQNQIDLQSNNPVIRTGTSVAVSPLSIQITGEIPFQAGPDPTRIFPPVANIDINKPAPSVSLGFRLTVPATNIAVSGIEPDIILDDYFMSLTAQIYAWDREFRVDWWAD